MSEINSNAHTTFVESEWRGLQRRKKEKTNKFQKKGKIEKEMIHVDLWYFNNKSLIVVL